MGGLARASGSTYERRHDLRNLQFLLVESIGSQQLLSEQPDSGDDDFALVCRRDLIRDDFDRIPNRLYEVAPHPQPHQRFLFGGSGIGNVGRLPLRRPTAISGS